MQPAQITEWLNGPQGAVAARLATLVALALLAWQLAGLTWLAVPLPEGEPPAPLTTTQGAVTSAKAPRKKGPDIARIADWHLFGQAQVRPAPVAKGPIDAPETRLSLTLRGVFASADEGRARAIIAGSGGQEKAYKPGDALPGGARLAEIYPDRVILERNGRYETLRLPREQLGSVTGRGRQAAPQRGGGGAAGILRQYREKLADNPRSLLELVRVVPYTERGSFAGFRVYPGSRPQLFKEVGLRPGDLVLEVNGIVLDDASRGMEVLQNLRESDQLNLRIRRGRKEMDLSFSLS